MLEPRVVTFTYGARTVTNKAYRANNEDCISIAPKVGLFVIADGMGGENGGEVASRVASRVVKDYVEPRVSKGQAPAERLRLLAGGVAEANGVVYRMAATNPSLRGMGTTLSALLVGSRYVALAHVGDSRIWRLRAGSLTQLTTDHAHPVFTNQVTRAVGTHEHVEVDTRAEPVEPGDVYLLCTDGVVLGRSDLLGALEAFALPERAAGPPWRRAARRPRPVPPQKAAHAVVEMSVAAGSKDNCSAIVVRAGNEGASNG